MICSLLFYALYPLSRYLTAGRRAVVHGTAALDGGAVTTRRFTQSQTTLQDQWLCSSSSAKGKAEEGMKEQSPQKESDKEMEQKKEQPVAFSREEPQNEAMMISEEPQNEAMMISEEPQNGAMKMCEEPQNEAMKMCEEPQNEAMKMCEEPQNEAMTISEEPQNEAMTISEEPQNEAMKMCEEPQNEAMTISEEPQNEAMTISEEPQNEAMKMCEEPQNGAMKMSEEPQNGAMKMSEEPQNGAMKMCEEPQNGAIKMCEEPQNGAMKMSEEPQNGAMKMSEEPQNEAMKMSEEPQNEAMKMSEEPQNEAMKMSEEPQNEAMKMSEEPQNEVTKTSEEPQNEVTKTREEPQNEVTKTREEPQNEVTKTREEPQNEVTKKREEPLKEFTKMGEEPQNEAMKTVEMPQDKMEVFMQQDICEYRRQHTEEATDVPVEDLQLEQALTAQLKCLQTDYSIEEAVCPGLEKIQIYTPILKVEESFITAEERIEETTSLTRHQIQIPSIESETLPVSKISECWDEYYIDYADDEGYDGANSFNLVLDSQLSNSPTHLTFSKQRNTQNSLHFPAGLGLTEEVQCPLWQFPAGSYYPSLVSSESFEVMWRVWQSATTAEPDLVPFPFTKTAMFFTVMSYNILAQDLLEANQDLYMHCPLEVLDWSFRCSLLLEEILKWAPDILCLQEVQENHYYEQLYPALCQMGYTCVYKCRTGPKTDGCATCYRSSCFSEVSVSPLEFFRPDTELLNRHNVGLVLLLRPVITQGSEIKATGPLLCVGNTHLLFNPRRGDVKLTQLAMMLAEIDSIVKSCKANGEHCNIVLCGDFNSVPHMPLYQLVTTGKLHYQGLPAWMISGQDDLSFKTHCHRLSAPLWPSCLGITDNCQYSTFKNKCENKSQKSGKIQYSHDFMRQLRYCPAACIRPLDLMLIHGVTDNTPDPSLENQSYDTCFRHTISHHLDLESVYKHILPGSGAPEVTTVHSEVGATVDYIFYSPKRFSPSDQIACGNSVSEGLKLIGSLSLLSEDVLWSMKGLPNHQFPSDHLSLLAQFQLDLNAAW